MSGPDRIYLEPDCCADPRSGRMWCEDPDPVPCEDGQHWTEYLRATPELLALIEAAKDMRHSVLEYTGAPAHDVAVRNILAATLTYARTQEAP